MRIAAVVLAAGGSSRLGRPKQLLEIGGEPLVALACRTAAEAGCAPVIAVLGAQADEMRKRLPEGVRAVLNEGWADGMGGSLALGVEAAAEADAVLVLLADQPGVLPATIRRMRQLLTEPGISMVWCEQEGAPGPPVMFAATHFGELRQLRGDEGGRSVVKRHPNAVAVVKVPGRRWDIDDEAAWQSFLSQ